MTDDKPDYGTPPEPKYGRRTPPAPVDAEQIARLRKAVRDAEPSTEPRRDPPGIVLASVLIAFSFGFSALAMLGGWWSLMWVPFAPFALFGSVGMHLSVRKVPRDEKGNPIS